MNSEAELTQLAKVAQIGVFAISMFFSCTSQASAPYHIGDTGPGNGRIFFVYDGGSHGLEAETFDQSGFVKWTSGVFTPDNNATRDGINAGIYNTERIISKQGAGNYAAQVCGKYLSGSGFTRIGDWYLPAKWELALLTQIVGLGLDYYWSSTEYGTGAVWVQGGGGFQITRQRDNTAKVRCVRSF